MFRYSLPLVLMVFFFLNLSNSIGQNLKVEKLSGMINSDAYDEISPVISRDGNKLFFTRVACPVYNRFLLVNGKDISSSPPEKFNRHIRKIYSEIAGYEVSNPAFSEFNQDVWVAYFENGEFTKVHHPGPPLNNALPNSVCTTTPEHNAYVVINQFKENGGMDKGFSIVREYSDMVWSFPEPVYIEGYETRSEGVNVNMSADGEVLILSVDRVEGYGSNDLFVSFNLGENHYSKPVNLGSSINTAYKEITPFLSNDKRILFFASNRLGNNDLYWTERLDDSWMNWSIPKRFIDPVNSPYDDSQPFFHAASGYLYFTSKRNGTSDIYRIKIQEGKNKELVLRGTVLNSQTGEKENGIVYIGKSEKKRYQMTLNANSGEFNYQVYPGESMKAQVFKEGFISQVVNFEIPKDYSRPFFDLTLYLDPLVEGGKISLAPIFFEKSKPAILDKSKPDLDGLLTTLRVHQGLHILIEGHTDNQGPEEALKKLSFERADEVKLYLTERGISSGRIAVIGYGSSKPITDNSNEKERSKNRRVEIKISHILDLVEGK